MTIQTIKKILIANRGEIACRVMRTAKERGIATVAVFSDADRYALHTRMADESVHIGGSASSESYLSIDAIINAAKLTGADAVHPGFGFLSENSQFAQALEAADIRFIGPRQHAIEAMGDKITSKKLAAEAGVTTVPGHPDAVADADEAYMIAERIGVPVMLKASAGGGGKGMRVAATLDDVRDGFESARNEARTAFGDDRVFVEKFIEQPRHIEIQVIADMHGNCLHLGERECSIQRRHQKVIEEAPSSFISEETRQAMGAEAVALAQAVDYISAGTVEFIVDSNQSFFFLEMNTRLQVEHPVTECITGLDLVSLMIDVAEGKPLPLQQADVQRNGWSFEARVYAEDADRGFLPSTGRITQYEPPGDTPDPNTTIRVDTGIEAGGEISIHYDPMIAKLVTHASTRDTAIELMQQALAGYTIDGVQSNIPFLEALFDHPSLKAGQLTTHFIDEHFPGGFNSREFASRSIDQLPVLAAWLEWQCRQRDHLGKPLDNQPLIVVSGDDRRIIEREEIASINSTWTPGASRFVGSLNGKPLHAAVQRQSNQWHLAAGGSRRAYTVVEPHVAPLLDLMPVKQVADMSRFLLSPMPGLLVKVLVAPGDSVTVGQDLAVVEAMKMENTLKAEISGVVKEVKADAGDSLAVDAHILEFE